MDKTNTDPSAYIASLIPGRREVVSSLDQRISAALPGQSRTLWTGKFWGGSVQTIIGYGDLTTRQSSGKTVHWFMVGLAVQKNYFSLYVNAVEDAQYVAEKYRDELGQVKIGKASISFKKLEDLDLTGLDKVLSIARDQLHRQAR